MALKCDYVVDDTLHLTNKTVASNHFHIKERKLTTANYFSIFTKPRHHMTDETLT